MIHSLVKHIFAHLGFELRRSGSHPNLHRNTLKGAFEHLKQLGLQPGTVIDGGAADGTPELYLTFPDSQHLLIEPLEEFKPALERLKLTYPKLDYVIAAASSRLGTSTINVHKDLFGSSLFLENEDSSVNGVPRSISTVTIDQLCLSARPPFLLKLDVHGSELDALLGAEDTLLKAECVVIETYLFGIFAGGPQFHDVYSHMANRGFVLYDIVGIEYRPLDNAVHQLDAIFVPADSNLRRTHSYASAEQRRHSDRRLSEVLKTRGIQ